MAPSVVCTPRAAAVLPGAARFADAVGHQVFPADFDLSVLATAADAVLVHDAAVRIGVKEAVSMKGLSPLAEPVSAAALAVFAAPVAVFLVVWIVLVEAPALPRRWWTVAVHDGAFQDPCLLLVFDQEPRRVIKV